MRIQPSGKSPAVGSAPRGQQDKSAAASAAAGTDHVDLSSLSQAVAGLTPARIEQLQAHVQSGLYEVNAAELSRRIVDFYLIPIE
jgi:anti-sigma28 factor (negative regulator of flagellin synthesis)